ncbi:MAG TPA: hypothetical protein DCE07_00960 [Peptococcaceae bacterium]|nr:hypothetical protein [Peptococcaceae bacterium]
MKKHPAAILWEPALLDFLQSKTGQISNCFRHSQPELLLLPFPDSNVDIQEFIIASLSTSFREVLRIGTQVFHRLGAFFTVNDGIVL